MAILHSSTRDLAIHLPSTEMSSTASASATDRLTCWCHQCDMSVTLLFSFTSSSSPTISLPCPHCHSLSLEHMDSPPNLISNSHFDFLFADYDFDCDDSSTSDTASNSVTDAWQSSITSVVISDCLSQELCVICKDEFFVDSEAKQLPCKHLYHSHCILPWLSHHSSCPLCRFQLIPGDT